MAQGTTTSPLPKYSSKTGTVSVLVGLLRAVLVQEVISSGFEGAIGLFSDRNLLGVGVIQIVLLVYEVDKGD
jgi:hypothetical protein